MAIKKESSQNVFLLSYFHFVCVQSIQLLLKGVRTFSVPFRNPDC